MSYTNNELKFSVITVLTSRGHANKYYTRVIEYLITVIFILIVTRMGGIQYILEYCIPVIVWVAYFFDENIQIHIKIT